MSRRRDTRARRRVVLAVGALALLSTSGTAVTAGMVGSAGSVDHLVQAYPTFTAGAPAYDDTSGSTIVSFTVTPAAGDVRGRVVTTGEPSRPYETCSSGDGTTWTCQVPGSTAEQAASGAFDFVAVP